MTKPPLFSFRALYTVIVRSITPIRVNPVSALRQHLRSCADSGNEPRGVGPQRGSAAANRPVDLIDRVADRADRLSENLRSVGRLAHIPDHPVEGLCGPCRFFYQKRQVIIEISEQPLRLLDRFPERNQYRHPKKSQHNEHERDDAEFDLNNHVNLSHPEREGLA
jgi:hypothetical protein